MNKTQMACAAALLVVSTAASAQVFRCQTPAGHTVYSDAPCSTGTTGQQIQRQRTPAEIRSERIEAAQAESRKQAQRRNEALQESERQAQTPLGSSGRTAPPHKGYAERLAERNAGVQGTMKPYHAEVGGPADPTRTRPSQMQDSRPPATGIRCQGAYCQDNNGVDYHRNGNFMTGPNGQMCFQHGKSWSCQ